MRHYRNETKLIVSCLKIFYVYDAVIYCYFCCLLVFVCVFCRFLETLFTVNKNEQTLLWKGPFINKFILFFFLFFFFFFEIFDPPIPFVITFTRQASIINKIIFWQNPSPDRWRILWMAPKHLILKISFWEV